MLLGCLAATAYFIHHAINGTHGLVANSRLIERSKLVGREIASLEAVRNRLQRDVAALSPEPPQSDIVEELARSILGFTAPGDLIVIDRASHPGSGHLAASSR